MANTEDHKSANEKPGGGGQRPSYPAGQKIPGKDERPGEQVENVTSRTPDPR
ncbi:MAG TPA: hypothetical protein VEF76_04135 [Patescibacteria group bacterium]|nr:hypothetical protein [Patescibacteria group bacterium]